MDNSDARNLVTAEICTLRERFQGFFNEQEHCLANTQQVIHDGFFQWFTENFVIPNKDTIPPLFRYSSADYYNIRNLETETLMLSNIGNMNDIFEGLAGTVDSDVITSLEELNDIAFIKSFTELKDDFLMWSHYGDKYAGMSVEYDFSKLEDKVLYHLFPVSYSKNRYRIRTLDNAVRDLYETKKANKEKYYPDLYESLFDIMALFLKKSKSWEYEKEWRIIATYPQIYNESQDFYDSDDNYKDPLFDLSDKEISVKGCIKSVYIGPKMESVKRKHIREICSKLDVSVHELTISKTEYILEEDS